MMREWRCAQSLTKNGAATDGIGFFLCTILSLIFAPLEVLEKGTKSYVEQVENYGAHRNTTLLPSFIQKSIPALLKRSNQELR